MADFNSELPVSQRAELAEYTIAGLAYGFVSNGAINANSAETNAIYINNPNTNTKTMYIAAGILTSVPSQANWVAFNMYYNPTITANGTAVSIVNLNAGSSNTSVMSIFSGPTSSAKGTLVDFITNEVNNAVAGPVFKQPFNPYYVIPPGKSMLITGSAKGNNTPMLIILNWFEQ